MDYSIENPKPKLIKIILFLVIVFFIVKGIVAATVETVNYINRELDTYSVNRVNNRHLIDTNKVVTQTLTVPVIEKADAEAMLKAVAR